MMPTIGGMLLAACLLTGCTSWPAKTASCTAPCPDNQTSVLSGQQHARLDQDPDGIGGTGVEPDGIGGTGLREDGIGGTGMTADGLGGTGIVGPLEVADGIVVNGLRLELPESLTIVENGLLADASALRPGRMIEVLAQGEPLTATRIQAWDLLVGPVEHIDPNQGVLQVFGQRVRIERDTSLALNAGSLERLQPGDVLRIAGMRRADGAIAATRIETASAEAPWLATGPITALEAQTMRIGSLPVAVAAARPQTLPLGRPIQVQGRMANGVLQAERIQVRSPTPFVGQTSRLVVRGYLSLVPESGHVRINDIPLTSVQPASLASDLERARRDNRRVQINARITKQGQIQAERIRLIPVDNSGGNGGTSGSPSNNPLPRSDKEDASSEAQADTGIDTTAVPAITDAHANPPAAPSTGAAEQPGDWTRPASSVSSNAATVPAAVSTPIPESPTRNLVRPTGPNESKPVPPTNRSTVSTIRPTTNVDRIVRPVRPDPIERPPLTHRPSAILRPTPLARPTLPQRPSPIARPTTPVRPVITVRPTAPIRPTAPVRTMPVTRPAIPVRPTAVERPSLPETSVRPAQIQRPATLVRPVLPNTAGVVK